MSGAPGNLHEPGLWVQTGNPFTVNESTPFAPGQLGKVDYIGGNTTNNDIGLGSKVVQYVKRYATDTATAAAGALAYWVDPDNFVVSADLQSFVLGGTGAPVVAGVFGGAYPAAGNYGFIQIGGVAPVRVRDATSATTVGYTLVVSTTGPLARQVGAVTTGDIQVFLPRIGIITGAATGTVTTVCEALLTLGRLDW